MKSEKNKKIRILFIILLFIAIILFFLGFIVLIKIGQVDNFLGIKLLPLDYEKTYYFGDYACTIIPGEEECVVSLPLGL